MINRINGSAIHLIGSAWAFTLSRTPSPPNHPEEWAPIETVCKMLGHRKITMTEIYAGVDDEKVQEQIEFAESRLAAWRDSYLNGK